MTGQSGLWLEHLRPAECWRLLASVPVARVGVLVDSAPEIYPVNFVVDDESIIFRTDEGTKLRGLARSPAVCLEADHLSLADMSGWSVLVKGRAAELTEPNDIGSAEALPMALWALGEKSHWIRIVPSEVTGRRLGRTSSRR